MTDIGRDTALLHEKLKTARLDAGLTMEKAAECLGLSQSTLSRIESGDTNVSSQRLVDLASAYGVSPSKLLDEAVVRSMSETDLDRIGLVIEFVEEVLVDTTPRPSPRQIRETVLAIFRQETEASWEAGSTFNPLRYRALINILIEKE